MTTVMTMNETTTVNKIPVTATNANVYTYLQAVSRLQR